MSRETFCQLTAGDVNVLMSMLEHETNHSGPFMILLREKLNHSSVFFREDIPANVVTLDTQFVYTVNGARTGPHVLVRSAADKLPRFAISVRTMRGLALLGLAVGEKTEILGEEGWPETLSVERIVFQPEADALLNGTSSKPIEPVDLAPQVINFQPRPRKTIVVNDDDPGPSAA